ncbi:MULTISPECIES: hypothetical protein [unclassified Luteococcus]|uniref:hypothetical protein n=1 Tax=unclassified Luteococcus TaxID=2639923 RepID=UPI00313CF03D
MRVVVEGPSDLQAAVKTCTAAGHAVTSARSAGGKSKLDPKIANYAQAARNEPWVIFRDSDRECPVALRKRLMQGIPYNPLFALRIAHTMTEAWLMADRMDFAKYFHVSNDLVPLAPDSEDHAKHTFLTLCLKSHSRDIREEVARDEAHAGPLFVEHLNEFARLHWNVDRAAENSPSLQRALVTLRSLPKGPSS